MIPWETPTIGLGSTTEKWFNVDFPSSGNHFLVDHFRKYGASLGYSLVAPRYTISDAIVIKAYGGRMKADFVDHPDLRALVANFCDTGDPVCFAAIYDYLAENLPEFLEER